MRTRAPAGTARTGSIGAGGFPIGTLSQINAYKSSGVPTDPTGLYTIYGGGNDIFDAATLPTAAMRDTALMTAVGNLATISRDLYALGARNFLVPNSFDVGMSPAGQAKDPVLLSALSVRFNELLARSVAGLETTLPGSTFYNLSLDTLQDNVLYDASHGATRFGITDVSRPCFAAGASPCAVSAFADDQHPTTVFHRLIAEAAYDRVVLGVDLSPVPEPQQVLLLCVGLAFIGVVVCKRRAAR